jgi:uncharacterized membrane protein
MAPQRLAGVDVARCIALFGMGTVHVLPTTDETGAPTLVELVFGGRSAALFAVLAGVGLALAVGQRPDLRRAAPVVAARAGLIGAIGLLLALFDSGVAVILRTTRCCSCWSCRGCAPARRCCWPVPPPSRSACRS